MERHNDRELTLEEIAALADSQIDYSDIPELTDEFFRNATLLRLPADAPTEVEKLKQR